MTKSIIAALCVALALTVVGGLAWAGIEGSKHDFSNEAWAEGDTCSACHTTHRADTPKASPLWDTEADLTRTFGTSSSRDRATPGEGTLMCLRCHDGTIASEAVTGVAGQRFNNKQDPALFGTGHRSGDHPVGGEYPQFDKGYRPLVSVVATGVVALPDGRVECSSCHDPHNEAGEKHMLVTSNARSALCLICHRK